MPPDLHTLRQQLRTQFPGAHRSTDPLPALPSRAGLPAFPRGALSELSPATPTASLSLLLARLLDAPDPGDETGSSRLPPPRVPASGSRLPTTALIDAADSFDPASYGPDACARLLWIRCRDAAQSLQCADLLLRDGNLPLLVLDLQLTPFLQLRRIPTASWYRLRNLAEQSGAALLAFTPRPILPCAALQLSLANSFSLPDLDRDRHELSLLSHEVSHAMTAGKR